MAPALQVKRFMVVDDVLCDNEDIKAKYEDGKTSRNRSFRDQHRNCNYKF